LGWTKKRGAAHDDGDDVTQLVDGLAFPAAAIRLVLVGLFHDDGPVYVRTFDAAANVAANPWLRFCKMFQLRVFGNRVH
jgi:hypothetical protein